SPSIRARHGLWLYRATSERLDEWRLSTPRADFRRRYQASDFIGCCYVVGWRPKWPARTECARRAHGAGSAACPVACLPARWHIPRMPLPRIQRIAPVGEKNHSMTPSGYSTSNSTVSGGLCNTPTQRHIARNHGQQGQISRHEGALVRFVNAAETAARRKVAEHRLWKTSRVPDNPISLVKRQRASAPEYDEARETFHFD